MSTPAPTQVNALTGEPADKLVRSAIDDVSHIATLPEITLRIIELVENPNSTAHDLHVVIANDPALSARVLKVVNSAFYALPGQIGSINRAIVLLGLNAVKNIAIAASLAKLFRGGQLSPDFSARDLWRHSVAVAAGAKLMSDRLKIGLPDEAFLAGLIHDVGIMVEMQVRRPKLLQVFDHLSQQGTTFRDAELAVFGVTHEQFGEALCAKWKFPPNLAHVAGYHHRPLALDEESRPIVAAVHLADLLAAKNGIGYCGTVDRIEFDPQVLESLKLTDESLDELEQQLPEAIEVADSLMS